MNYFPLLLTIGFLVPSFSPVQAEVVRPAPNFSVESLNGGSRSMGSFARQPVILIVAPSPKSRSFAKQLKEIESLYRQYAGRETLFVAAFTKTTGMVASDIPFLYAREPQITASLYGSEKGGFALALIGPDRNVDLLTNKVTTAEVLRDVLDNSYARQSVRRK